MPLDQNAIDDLKNIYLKKFGEKLTNEEAWDMGISLLRLFKVLARNCQRAEKSEPDNLTKIHPFR